MPAKKYFTEEERKEARRLSKRRSEERIRNKLTPEEWKLRIKNKRSKSQIYYQQKRRNTKEGYADRLMERVKSICKDTDLTREYLLSLIDKGCNITGKSFIYENPFNSFHNPYSPSLDQIIPKGGYYKNNVQMILQCVNRMKNDLHQKDFEIVWNALTKS